MHLVEWNAANLWTILGIGLLLLECGRSFLKATSPTGGFSRDTFYLREYAAIKRQLKRIMHQASNSYSWYNLLGTNIPRESGNKVIFELSGT
ncbi:hypothetical protein B0H11DRAFT_259251 [Mycena galericulata]|nr:hypothetical protein B0H11DRAFT_259251 [Mycena galericulata]